MASSAYSSSASSYIFNSISLVRHPNTFAQATHRPQPKRSLLVLRCHSAVELTRPSGPLSRRECAVRAWGLWLDPTRVRR
ncbi:hypothetical protein [Acidovorax sp.]|uniref:hypothetical protein n=1 Tax=Acidovorax sp. TaxID=1872122 RepID=UPI003441B4BA